MQQTYTVTVEGRTYEVNEGVHQLFYRCEHGLHIIAWSDHNTPEQIPPAQVCPGCGPKALVGGCHDRHDHHPDHQPGPAVVYPPPGVDFDRWLTDYHQQRKKGAK